MESMIKPGVHFARPEWRRGFPQGLSRKWVVLILPSCDTPAAPSRPAIPRFPQEDRENRRPSSWHLA